MHSTSNHLGLNYTHGRFFLWWCRNPLPHPRCYEFFTFTHGWNLNLAIRIHFCRRCWDVALFTFVTWHMCFLKIEMYFCWSKIRNDQSNQDFLSRGLSCKLWKYEVDITSLFIHLFINFILTLELHFHPQILAGKFRLPWQNFHPKMFKSNY